MFDVIQRITVLPDYQLGLLYQDETAVVVDFKPVIAASGVFTPLNDPAFFAQVHLGRRGRSIVWPGELDFCADSLRLDGQPVDPAWLAALESHPA